MVNIGDDSEINSSSEALARTGICVSGGGIRAAAFATGALQALDSHLGLLRGECCARYISAVSGGSYIAGAITLVNAGKRSRTTDGEMIEDIQDLGRGDRPFKRGSPEEDHLSRHCRYVIEDGGAVASLRIVGLMCVGFIAFFGMISVFATFLLACPATLGGSVFGGRLLPSDIRLQWILASLYVVGIGFLLTRMSAGDDRPIDDGASAGPKQAVVTGVITIVYLTFYFIVIFGCAPSFLARIRSVGLLSTPMWLWHNGFGFALAVSIIAFVAILFLVTGHRKMALTVTLFAFASALQAILVLSTLWLAVYIFDHRISLGGWQSVAILFGAAALFDLSGPLMDRLSPHRAYREMLSRCFMVARGTPLVVPLHPERIAMSSLAPPRMGQPDSFPELLICAAANVSDVGASAAGTNVISLVITPSQVYVPGIPEASIPVNRFESENRPASLFGWKKEPMMSLATAVAITGAAVSPAMGRMTNKYLRQIFTLMNLRLGVWLPNPLNVVVRGETKKGDLAANISAREWWMRDNSRFLREFFGAHSSKSRSIYVSDGGHYENLGLVELVRLGCTTIWCIDSSGGQAGNSAGLTQSILLTEAATGVRVELDLDRFAAAPDTARAKTRVLNTYAVGKIHYPSETVGDLIVIKLGLSVDSLSTLREYQKSDPAFPHHSTAVQTYRAERFTAYRELGWDSASKAIGAAASNRIVSGG